MLTNPPYSSDHLPRLLQFCAQKSKPFLLLLPQWVAKKPYFAELPRRLKENIFFIAPVEQYKYVMPSDLVPQASRPSWVGDDGVTSPFQSAWFVYLPFKNAYESLETAAGCVVAKSLQAVKWRLKKGGESPQSASKKLPKRLKKSSKCRLGTVEFH